MAEKEFDGEVRTELDEAEEDRSPPPEADQHSIYDTDPEPDGFLEPGEPVNESEENDDPVDPTFVKWFRWPIAVVGLVGVAAIIALLWTMLSDISEATENFRAAEVPTEVEVTVVPDPAPIVIDLTSCTEMTRGQDGALIFRNCARLVPPPTE